MVQPIRETTTLRQHERRNDETTKQRSDERGNDKTTPPFGKSFLRPGGMRASAFRRPLLAGVPGVLDYRLGSCRVLPGPRFPGPGILGFRCLAQDPCQTRRGFNPSLPPRQPRTFRRAAPKLLTFSVFRPKVSDFPDFGPTFGRSKKHQKSSTSKNLPTSKKSGPWVPEALILVHFRCHFGIHFS